MNVVEPILFQCKLNPLTTAICVPGSKLDSITYGQLEAGIHNVARNALKAGITPGTIVGTLIQDNLLHAVFVLGLMHMGAVSLSMRNGEPIAGVAPDIVLSDFPDRLGLPNFQKAEYSWLSGDGAAAPVPPGGTDDSICRISLTSGSTGRPKGIAFSHRTAQTHMVITPYERGPRFAGCKRLYCDLGMNNHAGLRYAMTLLGRGGTIFFLGSEPADILQTIGLYRIEGLATSPYSLGEYLKFFEADAAFEVTFDHIICQGAMMSPQLSQRVRARLCQNLYVSYGSTETTSVAFGPSTLAERTPGAIGYIQPGVLVEAVDSSDNVLPRGRDGVLRIRSAKLAQGYVGDPETSRQMFRNGYFYSGDVGHITPDGVMVITGREKTALNIGGDTVSPELVEEIICSFPGIGEAGVFAANNELGNAELHALVVSTAPFDDIQLRRYCAQRLPPSCRLGGLFQVGELPRAEQGKLDRSRLTQVAAGMVRRS